MYKQRNCQQCGNPFIPNSGNQPCCVSCREKINRWQNANRQRSFRGQAPIPMPAIMPELERPEPAQNDHRVANGPAMMYYNPRICNRCTVKAGIDILERCHEAGQYPGRDLLRPCQAGHLANNRWIEKVQL